MCPGVVDENGMADLLERRYLKWLEDQVAIDNNKSYHELFERLHDKEFVWIIPNDDNRVADGLDIRHEFLHRHNAFSRGCSVLEVLIALSRRIAFNAGGNAEDWAWRLLQNLELHKYSGHIGNVRDGQIEDILERLVWRTYNPDGGGGFFPLAWPKKDQRKMELWYQMCAYIDEFPEL